MGDLLTPANIIVIAVIAIGLFFGFRRIAASTRGKSCCSDGAAKKVRKVTVADTDESHYPYKGELMIGGMSCEGCAQNVQNALNALDGIWATVTYSDRTAKVRSKNPIDCNQLESAVHDAGYYVMRL